MLSVSLKAMTRTKEAKFGNFIVEFATPGIGHLLNAAGCDFAFFDMEHSGFSFETLKSVLRYFEAAGIAPIVRVPSLENDMLARACDCGAQGLIAPMISTVAQAQTMINSVKYYPKGNRGVGLAMAHDNYRSVPVLDALAQANEKTVVIPLIETAEGAENVDAIAALPEIDALWVGHFDLSTSMGIPGEFDNPKFKAAMNKIAVAAKKHNKSLGRLVGNPRQGIEAVKEGFDFCCYSGDVWVFRDALASAVKTMRDGLK